MGVTDRRGRDETKKAEWKGLLCETKQGPEVSGMQKRSRGTLDLLFCGPYLCVVHLFGEKHQQRFISISDICILALVAKRSEHSDSLR